MTSLRSLLLGTFVPTLAAYSLIQPAMTCRAESPAVKVRNIRRVFHNGEHNAFTDLIKYRGQYYLTFRSCPDGHMVHPTASIIILRSENLKTWKQVHRFRVRHRDTRDPHFVIFKHRLFVYTGTWYSGATTIARDKYDLNLHLGYAAWTDDGDKWHSPVMLDGTLGHYIWRGATYGDKVYLCGRRKIDFEVTAKGEPRRIESLMLESDDGIIFRKRATFRPLEGDETAFQFLSDGTVKAIGRGYRSGPAFLLESKPPWTKWKRQSLGRYIGGPLLVRWGNHWVVGGRKMPGPKTSMYWLVNGKLQEFAELPSGGDTSYPGFIQLSEKRAVMSWYSSHEKDDKGKTITAIYMADLVRE